MICKSASVESQEVTEEDLKKINKFTLSPLKAEEVFTFKLVMGDNELDDRNYEPFNLNALKDFEDSILVSLDLNKELAQSKINFDLDDINNQNKFYIVKLKKKQILK